MKWKEFEEFGEKVRITIYKLISQHCAHKQLIVIRNVRSNDCETREYCRQGCQVRKKCKNLKVFIKSFKKPNPQKLEDVRFTSKNLLI